MRKKFKKVAELTEKSDNNTESKEEEGKVLEDIDSKSLFEYVNSV